MTRRTLAIVALVTPALALIALLAWAMVRSGGTPGGLFVNSQLGEISIKEGPAPDFSLTTLDGEELRLSDLRGKLVMIDFWSSWCPPCREEAPALAQTYKDYQNRDVEFIGIAIWDSKDEVEKFVRRYGVTYTNGLDEKGIIAIDYGVKGIPEKFFVDRDGNLIRKFIGPMGAQDLKTILDELLVP